MVVILLDTADQIHRDLRMIGQVVYEISQTRLVAWDGAGWVEVGGNHILRTQLALDNDS